MSKQILLVDDDPVIRLLVGDYLRAFGHEIKEAVNGIDCIQNLKKCVPEILILDLNMPDMTGLEVLKILREAKETRNLPVVLLSAHHNIQQLAKEHNVEADIYLNKPFEMQAIKEAIENI
jgi:putative two-component system response regulator